MTDFNDKSTASRVMKAQRMLEKLAHGRDMTYFFDDGYPREDVLQNDARAALEVLNELVHLSCQRPPADAQAPSEVKGLDERALIRAFVEEIKEGGQLKDHLVAEVKKAGGEPLRRQILAACGCRLSECESKTGVRCRMVEEIKEGGHQ